MSRAACDVCAAVVSDLPYDARVWKEARSLAAAGYRVALLGCRYDVGQTQRRTTEEGIHVVELPFGSRAARASYVGRARILFRLWREILQTPARVYHAHNIHTGPPAWLASRLRGACLVYDGHELYGDVGQSGVPGRLAARASAALERFLVRRSEVVVTTNRSRADVLAKRYGRQGIEVLANVPARVDDVDPLDPGFPPDAQVVLYQGGIYAQRAFRETIQALRLIEEVHLVILGFGRQADIERIRSWARDEDVAERVHVLPPRPFDELVRTAAAATVGIVPIHADSLNHYLGDTNKLHEYLMAGLPVVASDLPEVRRVIAEGEPPVGELFDPTSPTSIAAAIGRVLDERYEARRREARRLALERFNWEIEERRLLAAYGRIAPLVEKGAGA